MSDDSVKAPMPYFNKVTPESGKPEITIEDVVAYVLKNLKPGDKFLAPDDIYNSERCYKKSFRTVLGFYPNLVMTEDEQGRKETFKWIDVYNCIREDES